MFPANSIRRLIQRTGGVRFVVFGLLLTISFCFSQPQAPIVWGEARLLMNAPQGINVSMGVFAHGDTLVLAGYRRYGARQLATVCVSGDNGQSFSPWYTFPTADSLDSYVTFAVTSNGLYCCAPVDHQPQRRIFRSTDLGQTWQGLSNPIPWIEIGEVLGDTIWCSTWFWGDDSLRWTTDGGQTFSPAIGLHLGNSDAIEDFSVSDSAIAVTSYTEFPELPYSTTYVVTARRPNGPFVPTRLNPAMEMTAPADVEFDHSGTGFINSCARYSTPFPGSGALFLAKTNNHGTIWSASDTLESLESGGDPMIRHVGHEWMVAWIDTVVSPPFTHFGARFRFSGNNGRSWYPERQVFGDDIFGGSTGPLDLLPEHVRIYANMQEWNEVQGRYYFQWEGQIQRDSLLPVMTSAFAVPEILPADTTVLFAATALDNDSLWQMNVIIKHPDQSDSLIIPLIRQDENNFAVAWQVSEDSNLFLYSYRAEDMWEHVTSYPDSGWLSFITEPNAIGGFIPHPSSLILAAYPNPFNPSTTISFTLPHSEEVRVDVFDVTGKLVKVLATGQMNAGEHRLALNGEGMASGIYFVHMQAADWSHTLKLVLMR